MASAIYASSSSLTFDNCTFISNTVTGVGTISLEADTSFLCTYCYFKDNKGNDSSTIFANSNRFTNFTIKHSIFENNTSVANLINMFQSTAIFENVSFINNIAEKVNNGITLISSSANAKNITVRYDDPQYIGRSNYEVDTGFFNLNYRSFLRIEEALFKNCRGAISSLFYVTGSSKVEILENTLIENAYS